MSGVTTNTISTKFFKPFELLLKLQAYNKMCKEMIKNSALPKTRNTHNFYRAQIFPIFQRFLLENEALDHRLLFEVPKPTAQHFSNPERPSDV